MAKGAKNDKRISIYNLNTKVDPHECPFREFRDSELSLEYWGLGPQSLRQAIMRGSTSKSAVEQLWFDEQTQPLPQSVRKYLYGWKRAEDVASEKFDSEVILFEENDAAKMSLVEIQLAHPLVLKRSAFVRRVLSICFMLERNEHLMTEHQWENFNCHFNDGWRPKYHIYSPTTKPGGGVQHRPSLSKNGCYLVRLFYLGAWRCVWVNDQVPVSFMGVPLLPFAPLVTPTKTGPVGKSLGSNVTSSNVHLWPLLLCKALLKLAAPDISANSFNDEDELMTEFSVLHALTGCMRIKCKFTDADFLWNQIYSKVQVFIWDEDEEATVSVAKRSVKNKPITKDVPVLRRRTSMASFVIVDTAEYPPYKLPGITPAFEMELIITMCRDVPLKKPLAEPDVPLWKTFRWVDWAKRHGLYDAYDCPRTRFLKVNGLLKLSHAPHLLDVGSTESITLAFRLEQEQAQPKKEKKTQDEKSKEKALDLASAQALQMKEELREWILFDSISDIVKEINISYYPSQYQFSTCTSHPVIKVQKVPNKALDILCSKTSPLYLQFDSANENILRMSLSALHPRILLNCNVPIEYYVEPSYLLLEEFKWFEESAMVKTKAFTETRGYDTFEASFPPGRHYCRLWVHSHVHWHVGVLSESSLLLGTRDVILSAAARECSWTTGFLSNLGTAFGTWCKINRNNQNVMSLDRDFFKSYQPDLSWDSDKVGFNIKLLHWMFRQALQSMLYSTMNPQDFNYVCGFLRCMFRDPQFGIFKNAKPVRFTLQSIKEFVEEDPCVCPTPDETVINLTTPDETKSDRTGSEKSRVESTQSEVVLSATYTRTMMERLLTPTETPGISNVCDVAIDDNVPCSYLREERRKEIIRHEAATKIQAYWRGTFARKVIKRPQSITVDAIKLLNERLFGHIESLSSLMNVFFRMFPTTKSAYTISSGLNNSVGLRQYSGNTHATPKCLWIPYFQGTFYCHSPVSVHFDILSTIPFNTFSIFDNDTESNLHTCYNSHFNYKITPNMNGYTVIGHGTQMVETGFPQDINWQLTVLASTDKVFHVCDNEDTMCKELPTLASSYKVHIEEVFLPNRRNILGSLQLLVVNQEYVNFRVVATSPDLEMIAVLRHINIDGAEEVKSCSGRGEIYWPYIHLEGPNKLLGKKSISWGGPQDTPHHSHKLSMHSSKALFYKQAKSRASAARGSKLLKGGKEVGTDTPNEYKIEVIAPNGWPLLIEQWKRVDEIRNIVEFAPVNEPAKKSPKEKITVKDKKDEKSGPQTNLVKPQDGDAYIVLECSYPDNGLVLAQRDDSRDIEFANALKSWDIDEFGRNLRGANIRERFRKEYLEDTIKPSTVEMILEDDDESSTRQQGPSLASEMLEGESLASGEPFTVSMPETLKDKFKPLDFVPECTKEKEDKPGLLFTLAMADVEKLNRHEKIEEAMARMRELQLYNEVHQLERQKKRHQRIETLFVEGNWNPGLIQVFEAQEEAIAAEVLARAMSANKKLKAQNSVNASVAGKRGRGGEKRNKIKRK